MPSFTDILKSALQSVARAAKTTAATVAGTEFAPGTVNAFVYNAETKDTPGSSNVAAIQYDYRRRIMAVRFKSGQTYHYYQCSQKKAEMFFNAGSTGTAHWDLFRVRGSRWAHQLPFLRVS